MALQRSNAYFFVRSCACDRWYVVIVPVVKLNLHITRSVEFSVFLCVHSTLLIAGTVISKRKKKPHEISARLLLACRLICVVKLKNARKHTHTDEKKKRRNFRIVTKNLNKDKSHKADAHTMILIDKWA